MKTKLNFSRRYLSTFNSMLTNGRTAQRFTTLALAVAMIVGGVSSAQGVSYVATGATGDWRNTTTVWTPTGNFPQASDFAYAGVDATINLTNDESASAVLTDANGADLILNISGGNTLTSRLYPGINTTTGTITLNGGAVSSSAIRLNHQAGSSGSLILQGGNVLTTTSGISNGVGSDALIDIQNGSITATSGNQGISASTMKVNGSLATSTGGFIVVSGGGSFGNSSILAGSTLTTGILYLGTSSNIAVLDQNGGDVTTGRLVIDHSGGASAGTYNLNDGTLTINNGTAGQGIYERVGSSTFNFNGGTLIAGANNSNLIVIDTATVKSGGAKIDSNGKIITISQALLDGGSGGGLTKLGLGTLTLTGANTYTGDTDILGGELSINSAYLDDLADVSLTSGAMFNLNFGGTDTIHQLFFDGNQQALGTWGATGSGAMHINDAFFTGTGTLLVTFVTPEPSTIILGLFGLVGLSFFHRRGKVKHCHG